MLETQYACLKLYCKVWVNFRKCVFGLKVFDFILYPYLVLILIILTCPLKDEFGLKVGSRISFILFVLEKIFL